MMNGICKNQVTAYWINYPDNNLEGVRNTTNKQARIPQNLAGI
jgi:hypothetical protein